MEELKNFCSAEMEFDILSDNENGDVVFLWNNYFIDTYISINIQIIVFIDISV